jgi:hypothetical protein
MQIVRGYATGCNALNKSHRDDRFWERGVLTPCDYEQYAGRGFSTPCDFASGINSNAMFKK